MPGYYNWPTYELDEERDLTRYKVWLLDPNSVPALKPFDLWLAEYNAGPYGIEYGAEMISVPGCRGWGFRLKDGYLYRAVTETTDEEGKQRERIFRERIAPWIEDFGGEWRKYKDDLMWYYERLKKVVYLLPGPPGTPILPPPPPDVEKLDRIELQKHFEDWRFVVKRAWEAHTVPLQAGYHIYGQFEDICKELFGIDGHHAKFKALMSGFESRIFKVDEGLWRLGDRAKELGLEQAFQAIADDEELLFKLAQSEAGRKWAQELHEFLEENGWRVPGLYTVSTPSWVEKPSLAIPDVRRAMAKGGIFVLDQERQRLAKEREEVERDLISRAPQDEKEIFEKLMRGAQQFGVYNEEHAFYIEYYSNAIGRRITKEIGNRFAQEGVVDHPEDIYFLLPDEIRLVMIPMGYVPMQKVVQIRKEQWLGFSETVPRMFIGDPSVLPGQVAKDPVLRMMTPVPIVRPELRADLYGSASAPGVVEGIARVIMSHKELVQVQPGEILVAPTTTPFWTPLFGIVRGVVTDLGGTLAHAAIVGREYRIPVVVGTMEATQKIKTGDRLRVDGDRNAVYILEKKS